MSKMAGGGRFPGHLISKAIGLGLLLLPGHLLAAEKASTMVIVADSRHLTDLDRWRRTFPWSLDIEGDWPGSSPAPRAPAGGGKSQHHGHRGGQPPSHRPHGLVGQRVQRKPSLFRTADDCDNSAGGGHSGRLGRPFDAPNRNRPEVQSTAGELAR